jgi:hypothetical protein
MIGRRVLQTKGWLPLKEEVTFILLMGGRMKMIHDGSHYKGLHKTMPWPQVNFL